MRSCGLAVLALLAYTLLAPPASRADSITLVVEPITFAALPASTVFFGGTITNETGVDLRSTDLFFNFSGFDPIIVTPTQVLGSSELFFPDGTTSPVDDLFAVTLSSSAVVGNTYSMDVFLQDINNNLSNSITVDVIAIPEPGTLFLLSAGMVALSAIRRRRYKRASHVIERCPAANGDSGSHGRRAARATTEEL